MSGGQRPVTRPNPRCTRPDRGAATTAVATWREGKQLRGASARRRAARNQAKKPAPISAIGRWEGGWINQKTGIPR